MKGRVLVDSDEFWPVLDEDIRGARRYVYIQTLSFEGDRVGKALARSLLASAAPDRRLVSDHFYTLYRINDKFLYNPRNWFDGALRRERRETLGAIAEMEGSGVRVKLANPSGFMALRALDRNHKKIIAIDDRISYVGGINFTEHNFSWHDMMVRVEDEAVTGFLRDDFLMTWRGEDTRALRRFDGLEIHLFDGRTNFEAFRPILDLIAAARETVVVVSPYITHPFYECLRKARENGASVTLLTPAENNWGALKKYAVWESARSGIEVRFYPARMAHMKAMLIDGERLIVGSSNFDFLSAGFMQEIVAVITDANSVAQFRERVLEPDLGLSAPCRERVGAFTGYSHYIRIELMALFFKTFGRLLSTGR